MNQSKEIKKLIKALDEMSDNPSIASCIAYLSRISIADINGELKDKVAKNLIEVGKLIINTQQSLLLEVKINELLGQGKKIELLSKPGPDRSQLEAKRGDITDERLRPEADRPSDRKADGNDT